MRPTYFYSMFIAILALSTLLFTADAQWKLINSGTTDKLAGVAVIDSSNAIVIGGNGTILKTTDAGADWNKIDLGIKNNLTAIGKKPEYFSNSKPIIAVGDSVILQSTDGGNTWLIIHLPYDFTTVDHGFTSPIVKPLRGTLAFYPDSSIVVGTASGRIVYSTDDGKLWQDTLLFNSGVIDAEFNTYYIIGYGTGPGVLSASRSIYVKGDLTNNDWSEDSIGIFAPWQNIVSCDLGYYNQFLAGSGGELLPAPMLLRKTQTDSTWTNISKNLPMGLMPNKIKNLRFGIFICGRGGNVLESTDNGDTWSAQESPTNQSLNDIDFYNSSEGYAVGDSGTILFTSNGGVTGVRNKNESIPVQLKLNQNYPNPYNPSTMIDYSLPKEGIVQLAVYNNLGQRIRLLVNSMQRAGEHTVEFNGVGLPSGVYFYELRNGKSVITKKMILLR